MWGYEEQAVIIFVNDLMQKDPELATEYNEPVSQEDFNNLCDYAQSALPGDISKWKVKDLIINGILISRMVNIHDSMNRFQIIEMILKGFDNEITELSKTIVHRPFKIAA